MLETILAQIYQGKQIQTDPFTYLATFSFSSATTLPFNINIQADSDFIILQTMYFVNVAAASQERSTQALFNGTVLMTDTGSGRQLMDSSVPVDSLFGNGQFPYIWPSPKMLSSKSTFQVQATQIESTTQTLYLSFSGIKVFVLGNN